MTFFYILCFCLSSLHIDWIMSHLKCCCEPSTCHRVTEGSRTVTSVETGSNTAIPRGVRIRPAKMRKQDMCGYDSKPSILVSRPRPFVTKTCRQGVTLLLLHQPVLGRRSTCHLLFCLIYFAIILLQSFFMVKLLWDLSLFFKLILLLRACECARMSINTGQFGILSIVFMQSGLSLPGHH